MLRFAVLDPNSLGWLSVAVALEVVSEDLLEEYREASDPSVVDFLNFVAHKILCLVA